MARTVIDVEIHILGSAVPFRSVDSPDWDDIVQALELWIYEKKHLTRYTNLGIFVSVSGDGTLAVIQNYEVVGEGTFKIKEEEI